MKKLLLVTTPLLLVACHHTMAPVATTTPAHANLPAETSRQGQYIALPGQAAVDTDAAFEQHAAAFTNTAAAPLNQTPAMPQQGVGQVVTATPTAPNTAGVIVNPMQTQAVAGYGSPYQAPVTGAPQVYDSMVNAVSGGAAAVAAPVMGMMPQADNTPVGGLVDYTLRITNATSGRVFVEAQDAAGEIYPCGFMTGSQSISSEKKQVAPIKGPITVVVRDPDKPDAPELRRYKVTPPAGYAGKTLEITIISGGLYQVSVDGQVRYITPTPVGKPDLGNAASTPAAVVAAEAAAKEAAAAAAAAPAAAAPAAPAPEPTPAGM